MSERGDLTAALLELHGRTYAEEIGFAVRDEPEGLFRLLVAVLLFSARIDASLAVAAARALADEGWGDAGALLDAGREARPRVLNASGYARYDESTSRMLGATCELLMERYDGDLRRLRAAAEREPRTVRRLLKECKGIGDVGVDIFFREAQGVWPELFPFVDDRPADTAHVLGLPAGAEKLAVLVPRDDVPRLVTALVRVALADDTSSTSASSSRPARAMSASTASPSRPRASRPAHRSVAATGTKNPMGVPFRSMTSVSPALINDVAPSLNSLTPTARIPHSCSQVVTSVATTVCRPQRSRPAVDGSRAPGPWRRPP